MHDLPLTARLVIWFAVPPEDRDFVAGDLVEDARGRRGRMVREALRSLPALLRRRWQRGDTMRPLAVTLLAYVLPVRLLDLLAAFVASEVPWRASNERSQAALIFLFLAAMAGATVAGLASGRTPRAALFVLLGSALCVLTTPAGWPWLFRVLLLLAPAAACWTASKQFSRE